MFRLPPIAIVYWVLLFTGCSSEPGKPAHEPITPPLKSQASTEVSAPLLPPPSITPSITPVPEIDHFVVEEKASEVIILVRTHGRLAGKVADDHVIRASRIEGELKLTNSRNNSRFRLKIPAEGLKVDTTVLRQKLGYGIVAQDQAERVRATMLGPRVLDADKFPLIMVAGKIRGETDQPLTADFTLNLHGRQKTYIGIPIKFNRTKNMVEVEGRMTVKQTDFDIQPLSLLAGSLKVKDEMEIHFHFVGRSK